MKQLLDLETFANKLKDKGYNGYFQTAAAYQGKLKESISDYLDDFSKDTDKPNRDKSFILSTYLQWNGEDKQRIKSNLYVKHENSGFDVQKMDIVRTDRYGQVVKKSQLTNLSIGSIPTVKEAIAQVIEVPKQQLSSRNRRFRM
jgi:hypothetical protein